ncbi:hypothetical protein T440DRAFT_539763, partial [Plenodomus tracheiphilus IPT5]
LGTYTDSISQNDRHSRRPALSVSHKRPNTARHIVLPVLHAWRRLNSAPENLRSPLALISLRLYRVRSYVRSLQKQGVPMPPHSFLFGHLRVIAGVVADLPPNIHGLYFADQIRQKYLEMDEAFYGI